MIEKIKSIYVGVRYKILISVFIILALFALNAIFSYSKLVQSKQVTEKVSKVLRPSMINLGDFDLLVNNGRNYINTWNSVDLEQHPDKIKLKELIAKDYPVIKNALIKLSNNWGWPQMKTELKSCFKEMDAIILLDKQLMSQLSTFDSYMDIMVKMETESVLEEINPKSIALSKRLTQLQKALKEQTDVAEEGMISGFDILMSQSIIFSIVVIALGFGMGILLSSIIVNPVNKLKELIKRLSQGELPELNIKTQKDEIGDMVISMGEYIKGLRKTSDFASEVGTGNFEQEFIALSEKDVLGNALVEMPDYFSALNKDFRYQLTVIGTFAQAIISQELDGNNFQIKTDQPNVKVSWQVTGVRNDDYAKARRIKVEVEKEESMKGKRLFENK